VEREEAEEGKGIHLHIGSKWGANVVKSVLRKRVSQKGKKKLNQGGPRPTKKGQKRQWAPKDKEA